MLKVYYCPRCKRVAYLSINNAICKNCGVEYKYLDVSYEKFTGLSIEDRNEVIKGSKRQNSN